MTGRALGGEGTTRHRCGPRCATATAGRSCPDDDVGRPGRASCICRVRARNGAPYATPIAPTCRNRGAYAQIGLLVLRAPDLHRRAARVAVQRGAALSTLRGVPGPRATRGRASRAPPPAEPGR